jgi:hypothetical protein
MNRPEIHHAMKQLASQSWMINTLQQAFKTKMSLCLFKFMLCEVMNAWEFGATHTSRLWKLPYVRIETHNMAIYSTTGVITATTTTPTAAAAVAAAAAAVAATAHFEVASSHKTKHTHTHTHTGTGARAHTHKHTDSLSVSLSSSLSLSLSLSIPFFLSLSVEMLYSINLWSRLLTTQHTTDTTEEYQCPQKGLPSDCSNQTAQDLHI